MDRLQALPGGAASPHGEFSPGAGDRRRAGSRLSRRRLLRSAALAGLGALAAPMLNLGRCRLLAAPAPQVSTRAVDLVLDSTVVDMLALLTLDWHKLWGWQRSPGLFLKADSALLQSSGINVFHPAVESGVEDAYTGARRWIAGWTRLLSPQGCFLSRVDNAADLVREPRRGRIGVVVGFQNSNHFRDVADVEAFFRLGQRVSQLTYNERNRLGSGCFEPKDRGLTPFGAAVVAEMNRLGMAVDVSHCGERTSLEAIAASRGPVLVTHSNARALVPNQPRCKSDLVIRRLAAGGGVMGITVVRGFVGRSRSPSISDLLDHFDHVARLVGVEHLGLGSDTDVTATDPATRRALPFYVIRGLEPRLRVFQIADGLLARGYSGDAVRLILGGNFLRVLGEIWPDGRLGNPPASGRDPFCPAPVPPVLG